MIRIFFLFLGFFFSLASAQGLENYPREEHIYPLNINEALSSPDFRGLVDIYQNIYHQVHKEDREEILKRVTQHISWLEEYFHNPEEKALWEDTKYDIQELCERNVAPLSKNLGMGLYHQIDSANYIASLCEQEQLLLRFQNNLARKNTFRTLFSNDDLRDSPFDTIQDLHQIDQIFYGEKFTEQKPPRPLFSRYTWYPEFALEIEFWQDQRSEGIEKEKGGVLEKKDYKNYEKSIVGNLAGMAPALKKLAQTSVAGEIATRDIFAKSRHEDPDPKAPGTQPQSTNNAAPDKNKPEAEKVQKDSTWTWYTGLVKKIIDTNRVIERQYGLSQANLSQDFNVLFSDQKNSRINFFEVLRTEKETQEQFQNQENYDRTLDALKKWNDDLKAFLGNSGLMATSGARGIHFIFEKILLPKPQQ